jgi:riboflavin kinase/FMN adenylyltransferase
MAKYARNLRHASRLLGRPVQLSGTVVRGDGRARRLGFPTANVRLEPGLCLPPLGVYRVELTYGARGFSGLMNLGVRPTFSSTSNGRLPVVCEVHLPTFRGTLYGRLVRIDVLKRLRAERRFPHAQALTEQIRRDLRRAFGPS